MAFSESGRSSAVRQLQFGSVSSLLSISLAALKMRVVEQLWCHPIMLLRDFETSDEAAIGSVALAAFKQFQSHYADWPAMASNVCRMADLAKTSELIIAERNGEVVGGVVYVGPYKPKAAYFDQSWPIIRMLVVSPSHRAGGIGKMLTETCLERASRDHSPIIALHTSPIMSVALPMYLRMGFEKFRDAPDIHGVPYAVYTKSL